MAASNRIELQSCRCKNVTQKKKKKKKRRIPTKLCNCPVASNWTYIYPLEQVTFPFHFIHFILHDERKQKRWPARYEVIRQEAHLICPQKFIKQFQLISDLPRCDRIITRRFFLFLSVCAYTYIYRIGQNNPLRVVQNFHYYLDYANRF